MKLKGGDLGLLLDLQKRAVTWDLPMILREDEKIYKTIHSLKPTASLPLEIDGWKFKVQSLLSFWGKRHIFFQGLLEYDHFLLGQNAYFFTGFLLLCFWMFLVEHGIFFLGFYFFFCFKSYLKFLGISRISRGQISCCFFSTDSFHTKARHLAPMKCPLCPYPRVGKLKRKNGENKPRENWQMVGLSWGMKYCVPFFWGD